MATAQVSSLVNFMIRIQHNTQALSEIGGFAKAGHFKASSVNRLMPHIQHSGAMAWRGSANRTLIPLGQAIVMPIFRNRRFLGKSQGASNSSYMYTVAGEPTQHNHQRRSAGVKMRQHILHKRIPDSAPPVIPARGYRRDHTYRFRPWEEMGKPFGYLRKLCQKIRLLKTFSDSESSNIALHRTIDRIKMGVQKVLLRNVVFSQLAFRDSHTRSRSFLGHLADFCRHYVMEGIFQRQFPLLLHPQPILPFIVGRFSTDKRIVTERIYVNTTYGVLSL